MTIQAREIKIPKVLRGTLTSLVGADQAEAWVDAALATVHRLCGEWELTIVGALSGGAMSLVLEVLDRAGQLRVLKVPTTANMGELEVSALKIWASDPVPAVDRVDPHSGAWLMEYLEVSPGRINAVHAHVLADMLHHNSSGLVGFPDLEQSLNWRIDGAATRRIKGLHPGADRLDEAVRVAGQLLETATERVLLHGDFQAKNILFTTGPRAIDPMPCLGDPDYDLALWMATANHRPEAAQAAAHLAAVPSRFAAWAWSLTIIEQRIGWPNGPADELYELAKPWMSAVAPLHA